MIAMHQKNQLEPDFPFCLELHENLQFAPHWHHEIELVYMIDGHMQVGLNNKTYLLEPKDIFIIGRRNVHHFVSPSEPNKSVIIQFGLSSFGSFSSVLREGQFVKPLIKSWEKPKGNNKNYAYKDMEEQILSILEEYRDKREGYQMALKARLFDLMVILVRQLPIETFSSREKNRQISRLKRLDKVLAYINSNYDKKLTLADVAKVAHYSPYHFTRFFKDTTGVTFNEYLNAVRVIKAEEYLLDADVPITEVAFMSGFNSIQTFNRVFKKNNGCTPTEYKKKKEYEKEIAIFDKQ